MFTIRKPQVRLHYMKVPLSEHGSLDSLQSPTINVMVIPTRLMFQPRLETTPLDIVQFSDYDEKGGEA